MNEFIYVYGYRGMYSVKVGGALQQGQEAESL